MSSSKSKAPAPVTCSVARRIVTGTHPCTRWGHTTTKVGNTVVVIGGMGTSILEDVHMLDTRNWQWSLHYVDGSPPNAAWGHTASVVHGNQIVVFGGRKGSTNVNHLHILDCTERHVNSWRSIKVDKSTPRARSGHAAVSVGNHVYIFGGYHGGGKYLNDMHILRCDNPSEFVWTTVPGKSTAAARSGHSMVLCGTHTIYVFGGKSRSTEYNDLHSFDIRTGQWHKVSHSGKPPCSRSGQVMESVLDKYLVIYGGTAVNDFRRDLFIFDTVTKTWSNTVILGDVLPPLYGATLTNMDKENSLQLHIFGGTTPTTSSDTLFSLDLTALVAVRGSPSQGGISEREVVLTLSKSERDARLEEALTVAEEKVKKLEVELLQKGDEARALCGRLGAAEAEIAVADGRFSGLSVKFQKSEQARAEQRNDLDKQIQGRQKVEKDLELVTTHRDLFETKANKTAAEMGILQLSYQNLQGNKLEGLALAELEALEVTLKKGIARVSKAKVDVQADEYSKLEKQLALLKGALDDASVCLVCREAPYTVFFNPCGHVCCCKPCSDKVTTCPKCRADIDERLTAFVG